MMNRDVRKRDDDVRIERRKDSWDSFCDGMKDAGYVAIEAADVAVKVACLVGMAASKVAAAVGDRARSAKKRNPRK